MVGVHNTDDHVSVIRFPQDTMGRRIDRSGKMSIPTSITIAYMNCNTNVGIDFVDSKNESIIDPAEYEPKSEDEPAHLGYTGTISRTTSGPKTARKFDLIVTSSKGIDNLSFSLQFSEDMQNTRILHNSVYNGTTSKDFASSLGRIVEYHPPDADPVELFKVPISYHVQTVNDKDGTTTHEVRAGGMAHHFEMHGNRSDFYTDEKTGKSMYHDLDYVTSSQDKGEKNKWIVVHRKHHDAERRGILNMLGREPNTFSMVITRLDDSHTMRFVGPTITLRYEITVHYAQTDAKDFYTQAGVTFPGLPPAPEEVEEGTATEGSSDDEDGYISEESFAVESEMHNEEEEEAEADHDRQHVAGLKTNGKLSVDMREKATAVLDKLKYWNDPSKDHDNEEEEEAEADHDRQHVVGPKTGGKLSVGMRKKATAVLDKLKYWNDPSKDHDWYDASYRATLAKDDRKAHIHEAEEEPPGDVAADDEVQLPGFMKKPRPYPHDARPNPSLYAHRKKRWAKHDRDDHDHDRQHVVGLKTNGNDPSKDHDWYDASYRATLAEDDRKAYIREAAKEPKFSLHAHRRERWAKHGRDDRERERLTDGRKRQQATEKTKEEMKAKHDRDEKIRQTRLGETLIAPTAEDLKRKVALDEMQAEWQDEERAGSGRKRGGGEWQDEERGGRNMTGMLLDEP